MLGTIEWDGLNDGRLLGAELKVTLGLELGIVDRLGDVLGLLLGSDVGRTYEALH